MILLSNFTYKEELAILILYIFNRNDSQFHMHINSFIQKCLKLSAHEIPVVTLSANAKEQ